MHPTRLLFAAGLVVTLVLAGVPAQAQAPNPFPDTVAEHPATIESRLREIQAINPDFVTVDTFGESLGGLDLWMADVHHPDAELDHVYTYYLDGNHHGNEHYGMETVLIFLEEVVEWSLTEEGAERLKHVRVVVSPMINPDGTAGDKRTNSNNVDLNRNYPYHWGLYGTSSDPTALTYRGESAGSEPETQANMKLMEDIRPDLYLSMHTGTHDIVLPWRADEDGEMPDWPVYEKILAGMKDVAGLDYREPSGAGESISWAYGARGALSLLPEVTTTQFEPASGDGFREVLKEEVALCWYGLEVIEKLGGHLAQNDTRVVNDGWGAAINVTFLDADNATLHVLPELGAGNATAIPAGTHTVTWEPRIQGDEYTVVRHLHVHDATHTPADDDGLAFNVPAPAGLAVLAAGAAALVAARQRRR